MWRCIDCCEALTRVSLLGTEVASGLGLMSSMDRVWRTLGEHVLLIGGEGCTRILVPVRMRSMHGKSGSIKLSKILRQASVSALILDS